jgi:hypothetical protein
MRFLPNFNCGVKAFSQLFSGPISIEVEFENGFFMVEKIQGRVVLKIFLHLLNNLLATAY